MSYTFELSKPLAEYGRALREWSSTECRPYARQADEQHEPPSNYRDILDTSPVPLGRFDVAGAEPVPTFEEGSWVTKLVATESITYGDVWPQATFAGGIGHLVVDSMGTEKQRRRWYEPALVPGGPVGAFALTEPHFGSDTSQVSTTAVRDDNSWVLSGAKIYCTGGATADYVTVFATVDKSLGAQGIAAFVVPRETPGFVVAKRNESKLGIRSWVTSALAFDDCRVPLENRLGWNAAGPDEGGARVSGQSGALGALSNNRPVVSATSIGLGQASIDVARRVLGERRAGFTVQRWSGIESDLERMEAALERGRRLNMLAQWEVDNGRSDRFLPAAAKAFSPPTAERIIRRCMQLIGPDGTSKNLLLEKWYRDSKIIDIFEGSGQVQRILVARKLAGRAAG